MVMKNANVCILDYGSGNVQSVYNLFKTVTEHTVVSNKPEALQRATHLVLPGVGSFGAAMEKIKKNVPLDALSEEVHVKKKPFLGICVGMQVLADEGREFGLFKGLGWIPGVVDRLDSGSAPLPHIGWNNVKLGKASPLLADVKQDMDFYFVHSYVFRPSDASCVVATTQYGDEFCSIVGRGNIFGVQFHPEKSQKAGRLLLENFLRTKLS